MSIGFLIFFWASLLYRHPNPFLLEQEADSSGPVQYLRYNLQAEMEGARIGRVSMHILLITLIYRLAFAKSSKRFFDKESAPTLELDKTSGSTPPQP